MRTLVAAILCIASFAAGGQALDEFLKALERGDAKVVSAYLDRGLDPNTTNRAGQSALMLAARFGHRALVALLIERKANVNQRSPHGDTALMLASLQGHLAVARLLVERGAQLSHEGWAPLHYAAYGGRADLIRFLIDKGAEKNALAPNGDSALMLAARGGHGEAARALLHEDVDLAVRGPDGESALRIATQRGDTALVELLKRAGAVD